jgi:hypothetical protein
MNEILHITVVCLQFEYNPRNIELDYVNKFYKYIG